MDVSILDQQSHNLTEARHLLDKQEGNEGTVDKLLSSYCLLSNSAIIKRTGLEFMYMNEYFTDLQALIHMNAVRPEVVNRQWAEVYQILLNRKNEAERPNILLAQLKKVQTECPELTTIIEFAKLTLYHTLSDFGYKGDFIPKQKQIIQTLSDPMLRTFFQIRLKESLFIYHWKRNEVIIARKYAYKALNYQLGPLREIRMNMNLGLTYLFETYEQGMFHFNNAVKIAKENNEISLLNLLYNKLIPFFSAHFKQTKGIQTDNIDVLAFLHIAKGENEQAIHLLKQTRLNDPFLFYYMVLATGEVDYFIRSTDCFIERRSNFFFARLPVEAMRNL